MDARAATIDLSELLEHAEWLRGLARRLVTDAAAADDLVQETWLVAMRNPPDSERPPRPWLAGVIRNLARLRGRTEARRRFRDTAVARRDKLPSTSELVEGVDTGRRLAQEVLRLDEPYRSTVILRYHHNLSAAEISRRLGVPAGTVRWRLKHGLDQLRARLDREWKERKSWCLALGQFARGIEGSGTGTLAVTSGATAVGTAWLSWGAAAALLLLGLLQPWRLLSADSPGPDSLAPDAGSMHAAADTIEVPAPGEADASARRIESSFSPNASVADTSALIAERTVVDESGVPLTGIAVASLIEGVVEAGTTDARGMLVFPAQPGASGRLFAFPPGAFPVDLELNLDPGHGQLVIPRGEEFSGRVLVNGSSPTGPIDLGLALDRPLFVEYEEYDEIQAAIQFFRQARDTTGPHGEFCFTGLRRTWSGVVTLPAEYKIPGREAPRFKDLRIHYPGPETGVLIELERLPSIKGRVLLGEGDLPVPGARIHLSIKWLDRPSRRTVDLTCDAEGRFTAPFKRADLGGMAWEATAPDGGGFVRGTIGPEYADQLAETSILDLGDLRLSDAAAYSLDLVITDDEQSPVSGAIAFLGEYASLLAKPPAEGERRAVSDAAGNLEFRGLREGADELVVAAPGYLPYELALGTDLAELVSEERHIELERATLLELSVIGRDGLALPRIEVRLRGRAPLFEEPSLLQPVPRFERSFLGKVVRARPGRLNVRTSGEVASSVGTPPGETPGRIQLAGIVAGRELAYEVVDTLGQQVASGTLRTPASGTEAVELIQVEERLTTLAGRVSDEEGEMLVGVAIAYTRGGGQRASTRSGTSGEFGLDYVGSSTIDLTLTKRGFERIDLRDFTVPDEKIPVEIVMRSGRDLSVSVVDGEGNLIVADEVQAWVEGSSVRWEPEVLGRGLYEFQDVPPEPIQIFVRAGTRGELRTHDPLAGDARFQLE